MTSVNTKTTEASQNIFVSGQDEPDAIAVILKHYKDLRLQLTKIEQDFAKKSESLYEWAENNGYYEGYVSDATPNAMFHTLQKEERNSLAEAKKSFVEEHGGDFAKAYQEVLKEFAKEMNDRIELVVSVQSGMKSFKLFNDLFNKASNPIPRVRIGNDVYLSAHNMHDHLYMGAADFVKGNESYSCCFSFDMKEGRGFFSGNSDYSNEEIERPWSNNYGRWGMERRVKFRTPEDLKLCLQSWIKNAAREFLPVVNAQDFLEPAVSGLHAEKT